MDATGPEQQGGTRMGRMDPADFAIFGLFLGAPLANALAMAVVAASNGVTAILYASSEKYGWSWFSDRSAYAETLRHVDGAFALATYLGLLAILSFAMFRRRIGDELIGWNRSRELAIPASVPMLVFWALGWLVLGLMVIDAVQHAPQRVIELIRAVILGVAEVAGAEFSESTMIRLQGMDGVAFVPILAGAGLSYCWAKDRCRRDATPTQ